MGKFQELKVWQRAMELAVKVYRIVSEDPISTNFGLRNQMQNSATSIPSNIAEGDELGTQKQSIRHFYISKGSSAELFTQALIAERTGQITVENSNVIKTECKIISSQLHNLIEVRKRSINR